MSDISQWSKSAAGNTSASPNGAPEGMAPSGVNDTIRENMAAIRRQMEDGEWFNWGDTPSRASATTFKVSGDVTTRYISDRQIKCYDASTLTGHVVSASFTTETTITVSLGGSLTTSLTSVALAILSGTDAIPNSVASRSEANSFSGTATFQTDVTVSGAFTVTTTSSLGGAVTLGDTLSVSGKAVFLGGLDLHGTTSISGTLNVAGTFKVDDIDVITGSVVNQSYAQVTTSDSTTTVMPLDDSIPQITEGAQFISVAHTAKTSGNKLIVTANLVLSHSLASAKVSAALFIDSTADALASTIASMPSNADEYAIVTLVYQYTTTDTSSHTYRIRAGSGSAGTLTLNGLAGARRHGGVLTSSINIMEIQV